MTTARQLFKSACDEAVASQELRGGIIGLHCSKKFARKSGSSKPQPAVVAWQYFSPFCRPLLAIAAVASVVPAYRECPPIQRLLHADRFCRRARDRSCAHKIGVSRLVQCPVRAIFGTVALGKA